MLILNREFLAQSEKLKPNACNRAMGKEIQPMFDNLTSVLKAPFFCLEPAGMSHKAVEIARFVLHCEMRGLRVAGQICSDLQNF